MPCFTNGKKQQFNQFLLLYRCHINYVLQRETQAIFQQQTGELVFDWLLQFMTPYSTYTNNNQSLNLSSVWTVPKQESKVAPVSSSAEERYGGSRLIYFRKYPFDLFPLYVLDILSLYYINCRQSVTWKFSVKNVAGIHFR